MIFSLHQQTWFLAHPMVPLVIHQRRQCWLWIVNVIFSLHHWTWFSAYPTAPSVIFSLHHWTWSFACLTAPSVIFSLHQRRERYTWIVDVIFSLHQRAWFLAYPTAPSLAVNCRPCEAYTNGNNLGRKSLTWSAPQWNNKTSATFSSQIIAQYPNQITKLVWSATPKLNDKTCATYISQIKS